MTKKISRIIVTGGWGFIGSRFILQALKHPEYHIKVIDSGTYAADKSRVFDNISPEDRWRLEFLTWDINDVTPSMLKGAEYIVNFAAESHVDNSIENGKPFIRSNIEGVFSLLESARHVKTLKKFVQISTDEVYGDMDFYCKESEADEHYPLRPSSYYSASKSSADLLVEAAARTFGITYLITRTCNNYGPGQHPEKFIPKVFKSIEEGTPVPVYGDGSQIREWIHVDDNAEIILELMLSAARNEVFNIGSGYHYKNIEVIKYIEKTLGRKVKFDFVADRLGHDHSYRLNSSKLTEFIGERVFNTLEGFLKDEAKKQKNSIDRR
jgi:dTDP-glucose 4,6-dehydratase